MIVMQKNTSVGRQVNMNIDRDYDRNAVVIKDYGAYFQAGFLMLLLPLILILWIGDFQNGRFEKINFYSFEFFRIVITVLFMLWFVNYLFKLPNRFKQAPSIFSFAENEIHHSRYMYDGDFGKIEIHAPVKNIKLVAFCIVSELPYRYGRWHYLSSWQLYRKSSIGIHIGKATLFLRYLITYMLFILPYKLWRLHRAGEPYSLLKKNLFIQFDNRNYFLVNVYSQKDLEELTEYFKVHDIPITDKTYFIPHLQNDGPFNDKEEVWTNEFKQQGEQ